MAANVMKAAQEGMEAAGKTKDGMITIQTRTSDAAEKVKEMGERALEVGKIVETIDDIADKTDMLALNAAVEAARAGEYGRGFAVVADQVRKLSEDSKIATRDIANLIARVHAAVREAVAAMEASSNEVTAGNQLASQSAGLLEQIQKQAQAQAEVAEEVGNAINDVKIKTGAVVEATETVSAVVEENTAAAEEMAAGSTAITESIENVASISEENSAAAQEVSASTEEMSAQVEEVSAAAQELADLAHGLQTAVATFKLKNESHNADNPMSVTSQASEAPKAREQKPVNGSRAVAQRLPVVEMPAVASNGKSKK
jgi:methyl-accepting chemotaxis protein